MKIYLGSKSPRRSQLLQQMGVDFDVLPIDVPEERAAHESPEMYSERVTSEKLQAAWNDMINHKLPLMPVLCADTEVVVGQEILGKPVDYQHAFAMLKGYSGQSHLVITSVGLKYFDYQKIIINRTRVYFAPMSDEDIHHYLARDEYQDKAGAYGIQSAIGQFISKIDGCFFSVMGLPLNAVRELLTDLQDAQDL